MIKESMMKWRVRRESRCNSIDHEDIRRSLEILDNVLAEYDDSGDCYYLANGSSWGDDEENNSHGEVVVQRRNVIELENSAGTSFSSQESFRTCSADGSTSQHIRTPSVVEQSRKFSPPPVPKRSPGTRLSCKDNQFHSLPETIPSGEALGSFTPSTSHRLYGKHGASNLENAGSRCSDASSTTSDLLSKERAITTSSNSDISLTLDYGTTPKDDEVFANDIHKPNGYLTDLCSNCGCLLSTGNSPPDMDVKLCRSPSVAKRRETFEIKSRPSAKSGGVRQFLSSDSGIDSLPVSNSPFLKKKKCASEAKFSTVGDHEAAARSTNANLSTKLVNSLSDSKINQIRNWVDQNPSSRTDLQSPVNKGLSTPLNNAGPISLPDESSTPVLCERTNTRSSLELTPEERIRRLDEKFAHVKFLLKTNQISPLKQRPPNFVPPPPPKPPRKSRKDGSFSFKENCSTQENVPPKEFEDKNIGNNVIDGKKDIASDPLCDRCAARLLKLEHSPNSNMGTHNVSFVEKEVKDVINGEERTNKGQDSDHFLPDERKDCSKSEFLTNTIEDLPKLLPTDTLNRPQYGLSYSMEDDLSPGVKEILTSTPKSDKIQLSTFSQSVSSLGYGSSQSDQDLNLSFKDDVPVPVTCLKSQTLPTGIRLVPPPTYVTDITTDCDSLDSYELQRSLDLSKPEVDHFRSSSAPPLKHLQRSDKKHIFGMSRKDKKAKDKNEDEVSLRSNHSATDGVRRATANGSVEHKSLKDGKEKGDTTDDGAKRKSVWKSILRRK